MRSCRSVDRTNFLELFAKLWHMSIEKICSAKMDEFVRLFCDRSDDLRMAVAGRTNGNAGIAVQENISIWVLDPNTACTFHNEFVIRSWITGCDVTSIRIDYRATFWSGKVSFDIRSLKLFCRHHKNSPFG